jgi:hypothetical protein
MKTGIELIAQERQDQIEKHGRTIEKDARLNNRKQLSQGAANLILPSGDNMSDQYNRFFNRPSDWDEDIWERMVDKPYKERLIIAGALIAAEIDRLNYTEQ